jgi:hypothetical protein
MDEDPEPGKLPAAAGEALERLLSREDRIRDLIAFLAALDPEPFLAALGLPIRRARVRREVRLGGQAGNADLVVSDEAGPVALLEIKAALRSTVTSSIVMTRGREPERLRPGAT